MKKIVRFIQLSFILSFLCIYIHAQENDNSSLELRHNSLNIYVGLFDELNINYERNICQRTKSLTNLRMGFGNGSFIIAGEGFYLNPSLVHLIGIKNSHLELNLGIKYIVNDRDLIPDFFAGYRYEKPFGRFIFRTGINWPTLINFGIGFKF